MNHELEQRLGQHLTQHLSSDHDPKQLAGIHKRARRRTMRTRIATGVVGLAALAGLGSLVPTNNDSNALITATQPTPNTTVDEQATPVPSTPPPESEFIDPPNGMTIIGDGEGGFIGHNMTSSDVIEFVRSSDGENWRAAETWTLPADTQLEGVDSAHGLIIATLDRGDDRTLDYGLASNPLLAVSTDLDSWEFIEIDLGVSDVGPEPVLAKTQYFLHDFARNGNKLGMLIVGVPDLSPVGFQSQTCGQMRQPQRTSTLLCNGDLAPSEGGSFLFDFEQRVFVSESGAAATPLDIDIPEPDFLNFGWSPALISSGNSFQVVDVGNELRNSLPPTGLASALKNATIVTVQNHADNAILAIVNVDNRLVPLRLDPGATPVVGSFPASIQDIPADEVRLAHLTSGPAGWVANVISFEDRLVAVEQNGWSVRFVSGDAGALLHSEERGETILLDPSSTGLPPHMDVSLFGDVRYTHPETGDVLVELTPAEALIPEPWAVVAEQGVFDQTLAVDGWQLGGNPLTGPLTLTSPDGTVREFNDGFAFDNDDISDGVETDIRSTAFRNGILSSVSPIRFYDDQGQELVAFRVSDIIENLITPVADQIGFEVALPDMGWTPPTLLLYSPDGVNWELLDVADESDMSSASSVIVGDDEILVIESPFNITRIPIDE